MAAYVIVDITRIRDERTCADNRAQVSAGIRTAGGTYLVRGGEVDVLEGGRQPGRIVVVRFDSVDAARRWWAAADYARLKGMQQASTATNMILVRGVGEGGAP